MSTVLIPVLIHFFDKLNEEGLSLAHCLYLSENLENLTFQERNVVLEALILNPLPHRRMHYLKVFVFFAVDTVLTLFLSILISSRTPCFGMLEATD